MRMMIGKNRIKAKINATGIEKIANNPDRPPLIRMIVANTTHNGLRMPSGKKHSTKNPIIHHIMHLLFTL